VLIVIIQQLNSARQRVKCKPAGSREIRSLHITLMLLARRRDKPRRAPQWMSGVQIPPGPQ